MTAAGESVAVWALAALAALAVLAWPRRLGAPRQREPFATRAPALGDSSRSAPGGPAGRLLGRLGRRAGGNSRSGIAELADLVDALCPALRTGLTPHAAVAVARAALGPGHACAPVMRQLAGAASAGEPLSSVWEAEARAARVPELRLLASAWALSEELGAPLAESLSTVGQVLRAREAAVQRLAAVTAGPRASMMVLALLPLSGPGVGLLFGMTPAQLYAASPAAASSLVVGCALALAGWRWSKMLLRRALRPAVVS